MTKKKKIIIIAVSVVLIPLLVIGIALGVYLSWVWHQLTPHSYEDVHINVPDSDLSVVVKHYSSKDAWINFFYVDENEEHVSLGSEIQIPNISYYPFETGDYEVINNQNGTFTIRWKSLPPNAAPEHWNEITYDFPTK